MKNKETREQKGRKKKKFISLNLFIIIISEYLLTASESHFFSDYDAWPLRVDVVKSIVERVDISISEESGIMGSDGRYYSRVGIGLALLMEEKRFK